MSGSVLLLIRSCKPLYSQFLQESYAGSPFQAWFRPHLWLEFKQTLNYPHLSSGNFLSFTSDMLFSVWCGLFLSGCLNYGSELLCDCYFFICLPAYANFLSWVMLWDHCSMGKNNLPLVEVYPISSRRCM